MASNRPIHLFLQHTISQYYLVTGIATANNVAVKRLQLQRLDINYKLKKANIMFSVHLPVSGSYC